jgi:ectoine hydroxylase-related dioxygenase (phytanoyl-CoA dioxygenase family)
MNHRLSEATAPSRAITIEEIEAYQRDGVICLRQVISPASIRAIKDAIDCALVALDRSYGGYNLTAIVDAIANNDQSALKAQSGKQYDVEALGQAIRVSGKPLLKDEQGTPPKRRGNFFVDTGIAAKDQCFRHFALLGECPEIAAVLLKSQKVNFYDDQIFVKEPKTAERTAYHQDSSYFHFEGDQACTMWIPVDPVSFDGGTIRYVRGSHRWGFFKPNVFVSQMAFPGADGPTLPDIEGNEASYDIVSFEVEPGDVLVHHHLTVHGSAGNASSRQFRRAASLRYCGDDIRFKFRAYAPAQAHHHHRLQDGDQLDCAQFPVVWPRPAGASGWATSAKSPASGRCFSEQGGKMWARNS